MRFFACLLVLFGLLAPPCHGSDALDGEASTALDRVQSALGERDWKAVDRQLELLVGLLETPEAKGEAAAALLKTGNASYQAKEYATALRIYRRVARHFPGTRTVPTALYNAGMALLHGLDNPGEARECFERILARSTDEPEPDPNLMEAYRNYHHKAQKEIAACHTALDEPARALVALLDAYKRHPYRTWCGTCLISAERKQRRAIARAYLRLAGRPVPSDEKPKKSRERELKLLAGAVDAAPVSEAGEGEGTVRFIRPGDFLFAVRDAYEKAEEPKKGRAALRLLVETFPDDPRAAEARSLLKD